MNIIIYYVEERASGCWIIRLSYDNENDAKLAILRLHEGQYGRTLRISENHSLTPRK
jgi:hypothetical protein